MRVEKLFEKDNLGKHKDDRLTVWDCNGALLLQINTGDECTVLLNYEETQELIDALDSYGFTAS